MVRQTSSADAPPAGLQLTATSAPAEAKASAIARPMPREPPVTNAFLPSRLKLGTSRSSETEEATAVAIGGMLPQESTGASAGHGDGVRGMSKGGRDGQPWPCSPPS